MYQERRYNKEVEALRLVLKSILRYANFYFMLNEISMFRKRRNANELQRDFQPYLLCKMRWISILSTYLLISRQAMKPYKN